MMRLTLEGQNKNLPIIVFAIIWLALVCYDSALAYDSAGISLNIFVDQGDEDLTYNLADPNDPVTLLVVIKNIAARTVDTERTIKLSKSTFLSTLGRGTLVKK